MGADHLAVVAVMTLITSHAVRTESDVAPWTAVATAFTAAQVVLGGFVG